MNPIKQTSIDLSYLLELVVKAMFAIVIVYLLAKSLIEIVAGPGAAKIISPILGIAGLFVVIVNKRVRDEIMAFGKKR
ncbi:MAG: hypothetical protein V1702_00320 [Candidatus Woesearchaeota archaeon]